MNQHAWQQLLAEYEQRITAARAMGGAEKLQKQRAGGRLDARERIAALVDDNSFQEFGTLAGSIARDGLPAAPADAIITGTAMLGGRPIAIGAEDFTVQGGSIGLAAHAKRVRLAMLALQERIPLIMLLEGAGERSSNALQRHPYAPNDLQLMAELAGQVPVVAVVMGASAGHGALSGLFADFIVMVEGSALFSAGPPLVAQSLGEVTTKEALGGADLHTRISGVAHNKAADEATAFALVRQFLDFLPMNAWQRAPRFANDDEQPRTTEELLAIIPRNLNQPYDMRELIRALADTRSFFELQPHFGASLLTGFIRLGGHSVAVLANQPSVMAGSITRAAANKAQRFLETVGNFHLPVLFLADNPGVLPGTAAEKEGTLLAAANMYKAQARLRAPKLHVTVRKAFGFGSSLMAMNPFDRQTASFALPGITLGGIPALGGAEAAKMSEQEQQQMQRFQEQAAWGAGDTLAFDEIIDPCELRNRLLRCLDLSVGRTAEPVQPRWQRS